MQYYTLATHHNLLSLTVHNIEIAFKCGYSIRKYLVLKLSRKIRRFMRSIYCKCITDDIEDIIYSS